MIEVKICSDCQKPKPKTEFNKCSRTKDLFQYRCKECMYVYNKAHRSKPEIKDKNRAARKEWESRPGFKEQHAAYNREWRKNNHEKSIEINRRANAKRAHIDSERKKWLYRYSPEYKKTVIEREKRYRESGRRKEVHRNRYIAKADELRKKSADWKKNNPEKAKLYRKFYEQTIINHKDQKRRNELHPEYIKAVIRKQFKFKIRSSEIPQSVIEIKRESIKLKRQIKNQKNECENRTNL